METDRNSTDEQCPEPAPEPELQQPEPAAITAPLRILHSSSSDSSSEEEQQQEEEAHRGAAAPESIRRGPVPLLLHRPAVTSPPPILPAATLPTARTHSVGKSQSCMVGTQILPATILSTGREQRERPPERLSDSALDTAVVSPISL